MRDEAYCKAARLPGCESASLRVCDEGLRDRVSRWGFEFSVSTVGLCRFLYTGEGEGSPR